MHTAMIEGIVRFAEGLAEKDASETQLRIGTDLTVMGRLGEFGQASIKRKADQLIQDFAECLARQVTMR